MSTLQSESRDLGRNERKLFVIFLAILVLIASVNLVLYLNVQDSRHQLERVTNNVQKIADVYEVTSALNEALTALRGYFILGEIDRLNSYHAALPRIDNALSRLDARISSNSEQRDNLQILQDRIRDQLQVHNKLLEAYSQGGFEHARAEMERLNVSARQSGLYAIVERMTNTALIDRRSSYALAESKSIMANRTFFFAALISLTLVVGAFMFLRRHLREQSQESRFKSYQVELAEHLAGELKALPICNKTLKYYVEKVGAKVGCCYLCRHNKLELVGTYAANTSELPRELDFGEGLIGEAAQQKEIKVHENFPDAHLKIAGASVSAKPVSIIEVPICLENENVGVFEIGTFAPIDNDVLELFERTREQVAVAVASAESRSQLQDALSRSEEYLGKLEGQQEELRVTNEELAAQTLALTSAKDDLQLKQEELRQTNEELEQQAQALEEQKQNLSLANRGLVSAKRDLEQTTRELKMANRYKSDFLANMSHELRTPLNSLLILSSLLAENKEENLSDKQVDFAKTIMKSGKLLLELINDILDLSKVEAGKLPLHIQNESLMEMVEDLNESFRHFGTEQGVSFSCCVAENLPEFIVTDRQRLEQILRNFLSNSFKFTEEGSVKFGLRRPTSSELAQAKILGDPDNYVVFLVEDTGIGIEKENQELIFEAFQQADSSTSRRFGGTGLGLTISRELSLLLQGSIIMESSPGKGSKFGFVVPVKHQKGGEDSKHIDAGVTSSVVGVERRRIRGAASGGTISTGEGSSHVGRQVDAKSLRLLIIEDDNCFADVICDAAKDYGFECTIAGTVKQALKYIEELIPDAIVLDLRLPDSHGLDLLESLKHDSKTRHIPVHVISSQDYRRHAIGLGAIGYMMKPVEASELGQLFERISATLSRDLSRVLVVEDDQAQRTSLHHLVSTIAKAECVEVGTAQEALDRIRNEAFDCIILDLDLPDFSGFELLDKMWRQQLKTLPPVIVYTGKDLSEKEELSLRQYSDSIIVKSAHSPERLVDEISLFLHQFSRDYDNNLDIAITGMRSQEPDLTERSVLIVDDDLRNIFALTQVLEHHGMQVGVARNGQEACEILDKDHRFDLVLMDIMMPVMDGLETMKYLRKSERHKNLPIIALTAKAMRGDEEKCLYAGASDYLSKPVDVDKLISLLSVWMPSSDKTSDSLQV